MAPHFGQRFNLYPQCLQNWSPFTMGLLHSGHIKPASIALGAPASVVPVPPQATHIWVPWGLGISPTPLHMAHLPVPRQRGHFPVPPQNGQPRRARVPEPPHAEHVPFSQRESGPSQIVSREMLDPAMNQVHRPLPSHPRHTSTRPKPPHDAHWTFTPPVSLLTRTSDPQ